MHTTRLCVHFYTFLKQLVIHSKFSEEHANLLTVIDRTGTRSSARPWMLQSTSLKWKKKRTTATHYWAWEREKALISVLTREGFDSSRRKSLGKQLPSVLAFLDQHEHHMEWSQLQCTLLSPSCWLWWDCRSVEVTESGHILHLGALHLLPVQVERSSQRRSHGQQDTWTEGVWLGRCPRVSHFSMEWRGHPLEVFGWGQAGGPASSQPLNEHLTSHTTHGTHKTTTKSS